MKKLLLSLGALSAVVAPVAAVVACGSSSTNSKDPVKPAATTPGTTDTLATAKANAIKAIKALPELSETNVASYTSTINGATTVETIATAVTDATGYSGSLASVAANKAAAETLVSKILSDTDYSMSDDAKSKLVNYLMKASGNDALTLQKEFKGILDKASTTGTHGSDDFAVIINGKARTLSGDDFKVETLKGKGGNIIYKTKEGDRDQYPISENIGDATQKVATFETQDSRWGFAASDFANARFVIYLQTNGTTTTLEVAEVVKFNGETHILNQPKDNQAFTHYADVNPNGKDLNDFATHLFTATKDKATV